MSSPTRQRIRESSEAPQPESESTRDSLPVNTRLINWSAFLFAALQSVCSAFIALNGVRLLIGVGAFAAATRALNLAAPIPIAAIVVRWPDQHIPRRTHARTADFAVFSVQLDFLTQLGILGVVDVLRDVFPNVFAIQFHSALPKNRLRAGAVVFRNGTSRFCSMIRARCSRTFTAPGLIPSACAVSSMFSSSRSLKVNTCR